MARIEPDRLSPTTHALPFDHERAHDRASRALDGPIDAAARRVAESLRELWPQVLQGRPSGSWSEASKRLAKTALGEKLSFRLIGPDGTQETSLHASNSGVNVHLAPAASLIDVLAWTMSSGDDRVASQVRDRITHALSDVTSSHDALRSLLDLTARLSFDDERAVRIFLLMAGADLLGEQTARDALLGRVR